MFLIKSSIFRSKIMNQPFNVQRCSFNSSDQLDYHIMGAAEYETGGQSASLKRWLPQGVKCREEVIDVTGTVVTLLFINPHSQLILDVTDENGDTVRWHAEFSNPTRMNSEFGWTRDILQPGDAVTLTGRRLKSGAPFINLTERAQVVMTDTGEQIFRTRNFVSTETSATPTP